MSVNTASTSVLKSTVTKGIGLEAKDDSENYRENIEEIGTNLGHPKSSEVSVIMFSNAITVLNNIAFLFSKVQVAKQT